MKHRPQENSIFSGKKSGDVAAYLQNVRSSQRVFSRPVPRRGGVTPWTRRGQTLKLLRGLCEAIADIESKYVEPARKLTKFTRYQKVNKKFERVEGEPPPAP